MSTSSVVDPQDKMRARDVNKVARGEQAPRPAHEPGTVSRAPPPSQSHPSNNNNNREHKDSKDDDEVMLLSLSFSLVYARKESIVNGLSFESPCFVLIIYVC